MDPITQIVLWSILALTIVNLFKRPKAAKALPAPAPKAVETANPDHRLVKTWIEPYSDTVVAGWRAKCSCGAVLYATNSKSRTTYGSESNAIERFEDHAKNFNRVNGGTNPLKAENIRLQKELADHKAACFCKDVSTVELLPLKG